MAVLPIVRLGHPALRTPAEPLSPGRIGEPATARLIADMIETMRAEEGVGLAAPQVGFGIQLFVYEAVADEGDPRGGVPLHVVINPMVEPLPGELVYDWEGCLSIPDLRGLVPRHPAVLSCHDGAAARTPRHRFSQDITIGPQLHAATEPAATPAQTTSLDTQPASMTTFRLSLVMATGAMKKAFI